MQWSWHWEGMHSERWSPAFKFPEGKDAAGWGGMRELHEGDGAHCPPKGISLLHESQENRDLITINACD